ncbi:MAG TPA: D-alanyl-D-alanine carboxypeptidase/D-alanyl-D-alanine-endopeptidase [Candidatus Acidoferrum sp.]|nr:D-alanyl-D-alanine carboxypeptidase/D-alanyl-D-alanine-endopeptidase [Candidatus Acidoferrum sp.]
MAGICLNSAIASVTPAQKHGHAKVGAADNTKTAAPFPAQTTLRPADLFAARAQVLLGSGQPSKGEWGLLIADAKTGEVLFEENPDRYFVPASNMKLFTTALALAKLGREYRFRTTLESLSQPLPDGKLDGPLFLVGRGDPNLSNRKYPYTQKEEFDGPPERAIAELADALVAKGVKEISGDIVGDDSYFPRERYPNGWEIDDMVWEYGAAISAIVVDDNTVQLTLAPGEKPGDRADAVVTPTTPEFVVDNEVITSATGVKPDLTLKREPGSNLITVLGTLPAKSAPRKLTLAIQEPALHAAAMLKRLLQDRGITVDGVSRSLSFPPGPPAGETRVVLAEHLSIPLGDSLRLVNKISQNLHTEMLLRTAARQKGIWTTPEDLVNFPTDFYAVAGIPPGDVVQTDGSGLSRHDLVTPRAIVALLLYAQKQPWFGDYYGSLPVAAVDGTLEDRMKNSIAAGRLHAKTGSVEHVRTRAGYAELPSGRRLVFSFMSNNMGSKSHEATDALDALSIAMMEEFDAQGSTCCKKMH